MASISPIAARVKDFLEHFLSIDQINQMACEMGHAYRRRKLGPGETIWLLIVQLLLGNLSLDAVRHVGMSISASALCRARQRLPLGLLRCCTRRLTDQITQAISALPRWCGRSVVVADGVFYYTPDTAPLRSWLGSKKPFGYPLIRVVSLFCLQSGMLLHQIPLPHRRSEAPLIQRILLKIRPESVLVLDRAYGSFVNLHQAISRKIDLVIRLKSTSIACAHTRRTRLKKLGHNDYLVRWRTPSNRCSLLSLIRWRALPEELILRQVSFCISRRGYRTRQITVITTLLDETIYTRAKIAELYGMRWEVELLFRHIKQTLNWEMLHCKSIDGVKKELLLRQMSYNLLRLAISSQSGLKANLIHRISFSDALHWLRNAPLQTQPRFHLVPLRPGRSEPRKHKNPHKNYLPMNYLRPSLCNNAA